MRATSELAQWVYVRPSTRGAITWQNSRGIKVMGLPMLRLNLQVYLQCDYLNWGTYEKIIESQHFLETKDSQVFLLMDQ